MLRHSWTAAFLLAPLHAAPPAQDPDPRPALEAFFAGVSEAVRAGDEDAFLENADVGRLAEEVFDRSSERLPFADRLAFSAGLRTGLGQQVASGELSNLGDPHELRRFRLADDRSSATAIVRYRDAEGVHSYMRWWLARDEADEPWRFYDFEDLDVNLRASVLMAAILGQLGDEGLAATIEFLEGLQEMGAAFEEEDYETARAILDDMGDLDVPDDLRAVRYSSLAGLQEASWELDDALASLAEARRLRPEMAILDFQTASVLRSRGDAEEAITAAERYREALGGDAEIDTILGAALEQLGRADEARAVFRRALDDDDQAIDALAGLARLCGPEDAEDVAARFGRVVDAPAWMDYLAGSVLDEGGLDGVLALCTALDALAPEDPNVEYWRAQVAIWNEQWAEALDLLADALPRAPEEELETYLGEYASALARGLGAEEQVAAYVRIRARGLPAFEAVCGELLYEDQAQVVRAIAASYAEVSKEDPWRAVWVARSWGAEEEHARAEEAYAEAAGLAREDWTSETIHEERIHNLVVAGEIATAYALEPREASWHWILDSAHVLDDAAALSTGLGLRAADRPDDPELPVWRGYAAFLTDDSAAAVAAFGDADLELPRFEEMGYTWTFLEAKGRSLARLGRFDEAQAIADAYADDYDDALLLAVVAAHRGDVPATRDAVERCLAGAYWWGELSADTDLEDALADAAFDDLREAYGGSGGYEISDDEGDG